MFGQGGIVDASQSPTEKSSRRLSLQAVQRMPLCGARPGEGGTGQALDSPPPDPADADEAVNVLLLTVFIGVVLVGFFVVMFLREVAGSRGANERDALLPLASETPRPAKTRTET